MNLRARLRFILALIFLAAGFVLPVCAAPLSGSKSVGPTGDYASLTAAIADVQAVGNGLGGALIFELQPAYVSNVETFPLTIPSLNGASTTNTLTIRPATGATALSITSADTTAATVDLNGAQFVTIDGRPGGGGSNAGSGGGTASQFTIANTSTSGVALRFINEASNNTIRYSRLQGVNTSATSGTVAFSTTTGANGNDNNTIDHCDIGDGASTPANGIYASGTNTTTAQNNSGNTVSNCNVFNFSAVIAFDAAGVRLGSGNTDWTIIGNSFFQTTSRAAVGANVRAIYVTNTSGKNFTVAGNFIGGSAPNAGGTPWTTSGTSAAYQFQGIQLNVATTAPSSVQANTITNMAWTSSSNLNSLPGVWSGIYVQAGFVNIGTVTGNTIGSGSGTGLVSVTTSGTGGTSFGIGAADRGTKAIANNTIGSFTVHGSESTISASLTGIQVTGNGVTAGANTISNNTVGSTTTANSLNSATSSTSALNQQVTGILSLSSISASITGNTVANLNNNYIGSSLGQVLGIVAAAGVNTITGNTVRNLSTTGVGNTVSAQSVYGINATSTSANQIVSQNIVHSLANTASAGAVSVTGIYFVSPFNGGVNVVARNLVHSLAVSSSSTSSVLYGMYFGNGTFGSGPFTAQNNMVCMGLKADGTSTAGASLVTGIYSDRSMLSQNFYHNSVYLGGTQTSGSSSSFAFLSGSSGNARTFQNNIFVNARRNGGASGKHYAVFYSNAFGASLTGLSAGGNIFLASGTGGVLGSYNGTGCPTLTSWQAATGQDATSAVADPLFVNPTGTATTVDLHLQPGNPAEAGGLPVASVTDDFDGGTRSILTPVDIGADAGDFTPSSGDIFAPNINYPLLTVGSTASRVLTGWATALDNSGSVSSGASAPRLFYKKATDADVFGVANDSTGNGWKYVTATGSGPYSFTLDYSLINGGSVTAGDSIQYFVVAQDAANNLGSTPAGATASANPPVQNVNGHGPVNSFSIVPAINSVVTVGSGGTFSTFSDAGGLFAALNGAPLTGDVVVNIVSDLTESGTVKLGELNANDYPPAPTLTIQPDSATMRTISGSVNDGLIALNGADRVTIDGRFNGNGRYLTFRNTSKTTSASTLLFINDASDNTVRNCIVEGAGTGGLGIISFRTGLVTGNDNNLVTGCQVRDLSIAAGVPYALIGSIGSPAAIANSNNAISNNDLFNFSDKGIYIGSTGNDSWTISGNNIHELDTVGGLVFAIDVACGGTNVIMGNSLHDLTASATQSVGIHVDGTGATTISHNRFTAFSANESGDGIFGIWVEGSSGSTINVLNNQITVSPTPSISRFFEGIYDAGSTGSVVNIFYNSVLLGGTETGTRSSWASYRARGFSSGASTHTARNNIFLNLRTGGSGDHFAASSKIAGGSYTVSNNIYAGTGATAANFMYFSGTSGTSVPMSFTAWQSATGDTGSQAGVAGTDGFTTAMFVNPAVGDLHLAPGFNPLVNTTGTPIAGVTDDFDGNARSATTPSIGSDEALPFPDVTIEQPAGSALGDGVSVKDFGGVLANGGNGVATFKITNSGNAPLTGLAVTLDGSDAGDFGITQPGSTTLAPGASVTFNVNFTPTVLGARNAAIHIASNVVGAKNPFDITLTGTGQTAFGVWAIANGVSTDPASNGGANVPAFAFGMAPGASGALVFNGTFGTGGTIGANGLPSAWLETTGGGFEVRALFVRRKDAAAAGLTYSVAFSSTLSTWNTSGDVPAVLADGGTYQIVSVPFPAPMIAAGMGYFHVSVTLAP